MPIDINELKVYASAVTPDDDTPTAIGGGIATDKKFDFVDVNGTVQVLSNTSVDTTQQVAVTFRTPAGAITSETKTLSGTSPVLYTSTMERLLKSIKNALTSGMVALENQVAVRSNTAQAGGASTITLDAGASAVDGFYNGMIIRITSGTGFSQIREIIDYVGATKVATVNWPWTAEAWGVEPNATSVFRISEGMFFDRLPLQILQVRRIFYDSVADVPGGATKTYYEKGFFRNMDQGGLSLTSSVVIEGQDPSALVTFAIGTAINDAVTNGAGNNRQVAPSGGVTAFDNANKSVPESGVLASGSYVAIWMKLSLPPGTPAQKTFYTPRIQGVTA